MSDTVFTQDPTAPHYHQCGRTIFGMMDNFGCGHLWNHRCLTNSDQKRVDSHKCPKCGRGPWYYVLSIEELESANERI